MASAVPEGAGSGYLFDLRRALRLTVRATGP